jgi:hypothetical protein
MNKPLLHGKIPLFETGPPSWVLETQYLIPEGPVQGTGTLSGTLVFPTSPITEREGG